MVLDNLKPYEVLHFFEEICGIPHGSHNIDQISDYLVSFAKERNLEVIQDEEKNVIIKAPATAGYGDREPIILQGHMDMVAVKDEGVDIDMKTEGLRLKTDGEYIWADGTSLGGDDGIAVAYCMALLDSKDIPHPALEVIITTNEETGMNGAEAIDLSSLKSKRMINIDNEEEGVFITSCAGGARIYSHIPVKRESFKGTKLVLEIGGLKGGHSGEMIKCGRGNANVLVARALLEAKKEVDFRIVDIKGGVADNAIPSSASAEVIVAGNDIEKFEQSIAATLANVRGELEVKDPDVTMTVKGKESETEAMAISKEDGYKVISMICAVPDGVQAMSASVEGLVETSLNLGVLTTKEDEVILEQSVRSSVESSKEYLLNKLQIIADSFGAATDISGRYPGWKFRQSSELRDHMVKVYKDLYGVEPKLLAIHAGLECGIFSGKIKDLDCVSIGPDMQDIHSAKEKLSVKSVSNVWDYLKAVLK